MERLRGYRFELDPTDRQRTAFVRASDLARHAYNWGLAQRHAHYELVVEPGRAAGEQVRSLSAIDLAATPRRSAARPAASATSASSAATRSSSVPPAGSVSTET